jgi:transcriptional regulator with XRE-family HTH domain
MLSLICALDGGIVRGMWRIEDLGLSLKILRQAKGLNQTELEGCSGVANESISKYEGQKVRKIDPETIQKLVAGLDLPMTALDEAQGFIDQIRRQRAPVAGGETGGARGREGYTADPFRAAVYKVAGGLYKVVEGLAEVAMVIWDELRPRLSSGGGRGSVPPRAGDGPTLQS